MSYLISFYFIISILFCLIKKKDAYSAFANGVEEGIKVCFKMFKVLFAFTILIELINSCGIIDDIIGISNNSVYHILISMLVRPFSSSSCMTLMIDCFESYGVDNINSIVLSLIYSCSDASVYLAVLYFSYMNFSIKKILKYFILINIISYVLILFFVIVFFVIL